MKILLIFDSLHSISDFNSVSNILEFVHIHNDEQYNKLVETQDLNNRHSLVVFLTTKNKLPSDWRISKLKNIPFITFIGINQNEIPLICNYLETIGILSIKNSKNSKNGPVIQDIIQYINKNTHDNSLSLSKISQKYNISPSYLSKIFKVYCGLGFREYIIRVRINKAKTLLNNGVSVTDTCLKVGYGNLTYFSKVFKKQVGVKPSEYQRQKYNKV